MVGLLVGDGRLGASESFSAAQNCSVVEAVWDINSPGGMESGCARKVYFSAEVRVDRTAERRRTGRLAGATEIVPKTQIGDLDGGPLAVGRELGRLDAADRDGTEIANDRPGSPIQIDLAEQSAFRSFNCRGISGLEELVGLRVAV